MGARGVEARTPRPAEGMGRIEKWVEVGGMAGGGRSKRRGGLEEARWWLIVFGDFFFWVAVEKFENLGDRGRPDYRAFAGCAYLYLFARGIAGEGEDVRTRPSRRRLTSPKPCWRVSSRRKSQSRLAGREEWFRLRAGMYNFRACCTPMFRKVELRHCESPGDLANDSGIDLYAALCLCMRDAGMACSRRMLTS